MTTAWIRVRKGAVFSLRAHAGEAAGSGLDSQKKGLFNTPLE